MHEAGGVRRLEAPTGLDQHGEHRLPCPRRSVEPGAKRAALDVLHHDVRRVVVLLDVVDRHEVRMAELRHRLGLAHDAGRACAVRRTALEQLERDLAVKSGIVRSQHAAHAARAGLLDHHVPTQPRRQRGSRRRAADLHRRVVVACGRGRAHPQRTIIARTCIGAGEVVCIRSSCRRPSPVAP
jgi:hypothetical protein